LVKGEPGKRTHDQNENGPIEGNCLVLVGEGEVSREYQAQWGII